MVDVSDLSGFLSTPLKYANAEQIKRAQEHAYALQKQPEGEKYTSWTQGMRDIANALVGRNILSETTKQQAGLMQQGASATAGALLVPTQQDQANQQPQTKIEGYNGPVPPMHQLPNKEAIANYALQLSPEAREKYLERVQELAKPVNMEVDNGTLVGNPVTQKWTFQPKTETKEQSGVTINRRGNEPYGIVAPGNNPTNAPPAPVRVNSEEELKKLKSGTPVIFPNGMKGMAP